MDRNDPQTELFVRLFAESQYEIHSFILTLVHNWADADDIMQTTSMVLWRKFDQFRQDTDFAAWACGVARLEVSNFRRVKGRDRLFFDDGLLQSLATVRLSMSSELQAGREFVANCMASLKPDDRELVHRCYGSRKISAKEVAAELGRPCNTVYKALNRIRLALSECVDRAKRASERI